ncbi:MAG: hypothetical protein F7B17_08980 [Desulfurococcales archaeon]|nr:hypothetical protein [Desulfurococcales archaeon]
MAARRLPPVIPASLLSLQLICEYRAYLEALEGGRTSPGLARLVARRVIVERRGSKAARVSVVGEVMGVPLAASPDMALLGSDGRVTHLVKASLRKPPRRLRSDMVYLATAALLLENEGMLAENAVLASVSASREDLLRKTLERIASEGVVKPHKSPGLTVYTEIYDRSRALEALSRLLEVWKGERPPKASPSPGLCSGCRFSEACEYSAASPKA